MTNYEELERSFSKAKVKYFEKYFKGKHFADAFSYVMKKHLMSLTRVYINFGMLHDVLVYIRDYESGAVDDAGVLNETIIYIGCLCKDLDEIIKSIVD